MTTREEVLRNDFGVVQIEAFSDSHAGLQIMDMRTGQTIFLDPLELECLAWASHQDLRSLLDPSLTRWRSDQD